MEHWDYLRPEDSGDPDRRRSGTGSTSLMIVTGMFPRPFPCPQVSPYLCNQP